MPGTTQVPCHRGPGVRLHSWWMESFLTLILPILVQIPVLGLNLRLSVVLMMNLFFLIFVRQIPKVIQRPMDPPRLPHPQCGRNRKESSVHGRGKISNRAANSEFFMKNPLWEAFMDPFEELDHEENLWDFDTSPTYIQEAVDTDLFRDIRNKILPAKAEEVAKVFSSVIPGDQVDTELCSRSREKIFEERKDHNPFRKVDQGPPCPWTVR